MPMQFLCSLPYLKGSEKGSSQIFYSAWFSSQNSMTALIVAVKGGYTEVVKELLKRNPNANMMDKDGNTALAIAAKEGHIEIVQDLLDAGSYVNITDRVRRQLMLRKGSAQSKYSLSSNLYPTPCLCLCVLERRDNADWGCERRSCGDSPSFAKQICRY